MSIEEKQQYLRQQIVEQGENAQKFYEHWESYNVDINEVDLSTVIEIVKEYKAKNVSKNKEEQQNSSDIEFGQYVDVEQPSQNHNGSIYDHFDWDFLAPKSYEIPAESKRSNSEEVSVAQKSDLHLSRHKDQSNIIDELGFNENQHQHSSLQRSSQSKDFNNVTFKEVLRDSLTHKRTCLKLQPNILDYHVNVEISIKSSEQVVEENLNILNKLWKGTTLQFTVQTIGRNKQKKVGISWSVKRTHQDFDWLRLMLIKMYPGLVVPPLPNTDRNPRLINEHHRKLQSFLLDCYRCRQFRNSKYLQAFLSYKSSESFESFRKGCENVSKPKDVSYILNISGEIKLLYSDKIDEYSVGLSSFLKKSSQHLKYVKSILSQINGLYHDISSKYKELSAVFEVMSLESCTFSEDESFPRLTQTYKEISKLINKHSEFCLEERDYIQAFIHSHFAYEKDRIDNMQNLIAKRNTFTQEFMKPKHQNQGASSGGMFSKLSNLFGEKEHTVDTPSSNTETLKDQVGYFNAQLISEGIRCIQGMITSHVNHFSTYGHTRIDNVEGMQQTWSQVLVNLSKLSTY